MRLHKHDELVEAMARAIHEQHDVGPWDKSPAWQKIWKQDATAALDALLEAAVRLGVGFHEDRGIQVIILRMEAAMTSDEIDDWATKITKRFDDEWSDGLCDHPYEVDFEALAAVLREVRNKALDEVKALSSKHGSHLNWVHIEALKSQEPSPEVPELIINRGGTGDNF